LSRKPWYVPGYVVMVLNEGLEMKSIGCPNIAKIVAACIAFLVAACAMADESNGPGKGFVASYEAPESPEYNELYETLKGERFLENLAGELNNIVALPTKVTLVVSECGQVNAFYSAEYQSVVVCYEILVDLAQKFAGLEDYEKVFSGAFTWILMHELGHALIHVLDLPITGKEEDVADEFATMALLDGSDEGSEMVESAAVWFLANFEKKKVSKTVYADSHVLNV